MHIAPPVAVTLRTSPLLDPKSSESNGIDLSTVRTLLSGGAPTSTEVIKAIYSRTGKVLQIGYGTTETGSNMHSVALELQEGIPDSLEELGSVGTPLGNLQVVIRSLPETSSEQTIARYNEVIEEGKLKRKAGECAPIDPGMPGEILFKGPHIMLGYYSGLGSDDDSAGGGARDAQLTNGALTLDGYYRTGDEGVLDYRGRLWITGRIKELIKVKGFQVPPSELDSLFAKHPEVAEAAAAGITEGDAGEQIVMYIIPRDASLITSHENQQTLVTRLAEFVHEKVA